MLGLRTLPAAAAAAMLLAALPARADDYARQAQQAGKLEETAFRAGAGLCRYEAGSGRLAISRIRSAAAAEESLTSLDCRDFDRTNATGWLDMLAAYEDLHGTLQARLRDTSRKVTTQEFAPLADALVRTGKAFACAFMQAGLKSKADADAPLAAAEQLARSNRQERVETWLRTQRGIVEAYAAGRAAEAPAECQPKGVATPIPDGTWQAMQGKSWRAGLGCPRREELSLLRLPYVDFKGEAQSGEMIVARSVAGDVIEVFAELHRGRFPIASMQLVDRFDGADDRSMAANNTSAFNCRRKTGGQSLSEHAYGKAIDINPVQNPYVASSGTQPPAGRDYDTARKRAAERPGMIRDNDAVIRAFARIGWKWGGSWGSPKDYQHFSQSGN